MSFSASNLSLFSQQTPHNPNLQNPNFSIRTLSIYQTNIKKTLSFPPKSKISSKPYHISCYTNTTIKQNNLSNYLTTHVANHGSLFFMERSRHSPVLPQAEKGSFSSPMDEIRETHLGKNWVLDKFACFPFGSLFDVNGEIQMGKYWVLSKLAVLLMGGLLFMGRFTSRPVMALSSAPLEEKMETHMRKEDEEDLYVELLEKEPRNVEALKVVVYGKMRKGRANEAVEYVERLIDVEPDEVEWRLLQALSYELMGQISKAKRLFKEILKEKPLLLRALHGLALAMHKNHEGPAVFDMLNNALEVAHREERVTEERNIKLLIAQMHVVKGELEEGLKHFQSLVDENPRDFRPYLCQGIVYSLLDKKKEADEQFEIYRSLVPDEFPQRGFLDDVVFSAKTESREHLQKEFDAEFSYKK